MPGGRHDHHERELAPSPGETPAQAFERLRARLLRYDIFPPGLMRFGVYPGGEVTEGALIVQRVGAGRLRLEFAIRVVEVWDRRDSGAADAGFRVVTLRGHPERGSEIFRLEMDAQGRITFSIDAWSMPGTPLVRLLRPVARTVQVGATRAALRRLADA